MGVHPTRVRLSRTRLSREFRGERGGGGRDFPGATDCHVHIIGPADKYPMVPNRPYTPPTASVAQLKAMHARLGIARTVLVQPSFYGTDNSCMLDALRELGNSARGVAVVAPNVPGPDLARHGCEGRQRHPHQSRIGRQPRSESSRRAARRLCQESGAAQLAYSDLHRSAGHRAIGAAACRHDRAGGDRSLRHARSRARATARKASPRLSISRTPTKSM